MIMLFGYEKLIILKHLNNLWKSGKKTLYDITNIKRIDQNRSTSANTFTTSLVNSINNYIPQSK